MFHFYTHYMGEFKICRTFSFSVLTDSNWDLIEIYSNKNMLKLLFYEHGKNAGTAKEKKNVVN